LGPDLIIRDPAGYRLDESRAQVDAARYESLVDEARTTLADRRPGEAVRLLDQASALWRGDPFDDLADGDPAAAERLRELRLLGIELRAQCLLDLAQPETVISDLPHHIAAEPLRERLVELMM